MMAAVEGRAMRRSPAEPAATSPNAAARGSTSGRARRSGSRPQAPCLLTDLVVGTVDAGGGGHLENPGLMGIVRRLD